MKYNLRTIIFPAACVLLLYACRNPKSPEQTALSFFDVLYNQHDLVKAEALVTESSKEKLRNDFKFIEGALQLTKDKEPVHYDYSVLSDKTIIKNDSAFITVKMADDGSEMLVLLLQIKNNWKVDLNYAENNFSFANRSLTNDVLEVMQPLADSIRADLPEPR